MAHKDFLKKFSQHIDILNQVLDGEIQLDEEYPTLYNELYSYYQSKGVQFFDDIDDDYEILIKELDKEIPVD